MTKKSTTNRRKDLSGAFTARHAANREKKRTNVHKIKAESFSNPFEERANKNPKHSVLNRKLKGATRNVALSRSLAHEKRKRTLLVEMKQSTKNNAFRDNRFGESNQNLSEEEKMLERFKRIRSKKTLYNLGDTDFANGANRPGDSMQLTHLGQTLGYGDDDTGTSREQKADMREFERMMAEEGLGDDDMEEQFDATELMNRIKTTNSDSQAEVTAEKKTKKEIMAELVAKAKLFKLKRQQERIEDEKVLTHLDDQYKSLLTQNLLNFNPTKKEKEANMLEQIKKRLNSSDGASREKKQEEEPFDEYEQAIRSLAFDARAAASDRTLTPEEMAKREYDQLKKKQEQLEKRMRGYDSDESISDDESDAGKDTVAADSSSHEDDSDSEDTDEENTECAKKLKDVKKYKTASDRGAGSPSTDREVLPFILDIPQSHVEFLKIFSEYPGSSIDEVCSRLRKSNSIHLKAENRSEMQRLLEIMLDHLKLMVEHRCSNKVPKYTSNDVQMCLSSIYEVAHDIPTAAAHVFGTRLTKMQSGLSSELAIASACGANFGGDYGCEIVETIKPGSQHVKKKGGHKGSKGRARVEIENEEEKAEMEVLGGVSASDARCWPAPGDFAFFRALEAVFPVSDFQHRVVSPAQLLLCQYLSQCPIRGPRDAMACIFTCQLVLDYCIQGSRYSPEVVLALEALFMQGLMQNYAVSQSVKWTLPQIWLASVDEKPLPQFQWLRKAISKRNENLVESMEDHQQLTMSWLSYEDEQSSLYEPSCCLVITKALCALIGQLCDAIESLSVSDIVLERLHKLCSAAVEQESVHSIVDFTNLQKRLAGLISNTLKERKPMRLLAVAPKPIKQMEPVFNQKYQMTRDGHDPDKARARTKQLKKEAKRERKGAARELRNDAQFIAAERAKEKQNRNDTLREERQKNYQWLATAQGELDKAVRDFGARGGGSSGADLRGKRRKTAS